MIEMKRWFTGKIGDENYDKMNVDYTEGEIQNRISAGVDQIAGVFPLLVSAFTNII